MTSDPKKARLLALGECRHERCRYGQLAPSWSAPAGDAEPEWTPGVTAICTFPVADPCPPAMVRQWGGSIELDRDCAVCPAFREVTL